MTISTMDERAFVGTAADTTKAVAGDGKVFSEGIDTDMVGKIGTERKNSGHRKRAGGN